MHNTSNLVRVIDNHENDDENDNNEIEEDGEVNIFKPEDVTAPKHQ